MTHALLNFMYLDGWSKRHVVPLTLTLWS